MIKIRRKSLELSDNPAQGWSILDGAYFCFTSLMTIGFGDFVPGNSYIYNKTGTVSEV